jgi:UDP-N-acetylmuramate--alanine ligase
MIGIGGCGMSGLARMLTGRGALVSGSDMAASPVTDALAQEGVPVATSQTAADLPPDAELVIASAAIGPDHPERAAAEARGLDVLTYAQALGKCMLGRTSIAIAGTHGKSTTSAMLGVALIGGGLEPTVIVGAACGQISGEPDDAASLSRPRSGFRLGARSVPRGPLEGEPGLLVAEACEYNRSFHELPPTIAAITSVEADHLDIYGSLDAVVESFNAFVRRLPSEAEGGKLLIAHDRAHRREVTAGAACAVSTIGFAPEADYTVSIERPRPSDVSEMGDVDRAGNGGDASQNGAPRRVAQPVTVADASGRPVLRFCIAMPGDHMAMNAATAGVLALWSGAERDAVEAALSGFRGLERRLQPLGSIATTDGGAATLWDDYGHHPTEIDTTLRALRAFEPTLAPVAGPNDGRASAPKRGRLICVFQPHQHSRTRHLLEEFAQSFSAADIVIVPHIYFVRDSEAEKTRVSAADLVDRLRSRGVSAMHLYPFDAIVDQLTTLASDGDVIVVMGAGPVWTIAHDLRQRRGRPGT